MNDDSKTKDFGADQKNDPPASWVREKLQDAAPFIAPAMAALLVSGLFCVYYFVYVRAQRDYLTNRNFRFLAVLGDQIEGNIANHGSVLRYFVDQMDPLDSGLDHRREKSRRLLEQHRQENQQDIGDSDQELREDYMRYLAPHLHLDEKVQTDGAKSGITKLRVNRHNGRWQLTVIAWGKQRKYSGTVSFKELLQPFIGSLPFDDVLLSSEDGSIIYQEAKTGPQFANLAELLQAETPDKKAGDEKVPEAKKATPSKDTPSPIQIEANQEWQKRPNHLKEVRVADTSYKLFLQPVLIDVLNETAIGDEKVGADSSEKAQEWVLCGLVSSSKLEWQSLAISYRVVIWATVGFLLIGLSAPLLKLLFLNKRERLTLRECAVAGISLVLLTGLMTFAALQGIYFHFLGDPDDGKKQLVLISQDLAAGIHQELGGMLGQLTTFCQHPLLIGMDGEPGGKHEPGDLEQSDKKEVYELNVVNRVVKQIHPSSYPNFASVFWTDDDGDQIIKWSTDKWATPMINIAQLDQFKNLQDLNLPDHPLFHLDASPSLGFHFDSARAPNKVDYFAAMGMRTNHCILNLDKVEPKVPNDIQDGLVFLVAKPFSLIDPVLPSGYGFALVDASGKVLFHSDKTRNTRENFLEESDFNQQLYSFVFGDSDSEPLEIKYLGQDYLVRVTKIPHLQGARWSLIVYRDLNHLRTLNLQTMTISSTLFLILVSGPVLLAAFLFVVHRPQYISERFWPHEGRFPMYVYQTAVGVIFSALLLYLGLTGRLEERVCSCAVLAYSALLLIYWCFRLPAERNDKNDSSEPGARPQMILPALFTGLFAVIAISIIYANRFGRLAVTLPVIAGCGVALLDTPQKALTGRLKAWFYHNNRVPSCRIFHTLSAASLLLLFGVVTPIVLFHLSLQLERRLQVKLTQEREAADLQHRQALNQLQVKEAAGREGTDWQRTQAENQMPCDAAKKSGLADRSQWDFTNSHIPQCDTAGAQANDKFYKAWFRDLISYVQHDFNRVAAEIQAMNSGGPLPDPAMPNYWESELVSAGLVILIATWILWAAGDKLFLHSVVPLHAWRGGRFSEHHKPKVRTVAGGGGVDA
jgi:hypothetical protein